MLQTDLCLHLSQGIAIFITQRNVCHGIPVDGNHTEAFPFCIDYQQKQGIGLSSADHVNSLRNRFIVVDSHNQIGTDIGIVAILFSLVGHYTLLPFFQI